MSISAAEVRASRAFLDRVGASDIPARRFAAAARELNLPFAALLKVLARVYRQPAPRG